MQTNYEDLTDRELSILIAKAVSSINKKLSELCDEIKGGNKWTAH